MVTFLLAEFKLTAQQAFCTIMEGQNTLHRLHFCSCHSICCISSNRWPVYGAIVVFAFKTHDVSHRMRVKNGRNALLGTMLLAGGNHGLHCQPLPRTLWRGTDVIRVSSAATMKYSIQNEFSDDWDWMFVEGTFDEQLTNSWRSLTKLQDWLEDGSNPLAMNGKKMGRQNKGSEADSALTLEKVSGMEILKAYVHESLIMVGSMPGSKDLSSLSKTLLDFSRLWCEY